MYTRLHFPQHEAGSACGWRLEESETAGENTSDRQPVPRGFLLARRSVAHLVILGDERLLVLVLLNGILGLEAGLGEGLGRRVVDAWATARPAATGGNDRSRVDFLVVLFLHASDAFS